MLAAILCVPACNSSPATIATDIQTGSDSVRQITNGQSIDLEADKSSAIEGLLVSLLESCAFRSKRLIAEADWQILRRTSDVVELILEAPKTIYSISGVELLVDGIIVSSIEPPLNNGFMLARNGDTYYSSFFGCDAKMHESLRNITAVN